MGFVLSVNYGESEFGNNALCKRSLPEAATILRVITLYDRISMSF